MFPLESEPESEPIMQQSNIVQKSDITKDDVKLSDPTIDRTTVREILEILSLAEKISSGKDVEGIVIYVDDIQASRSEYERFPFSARILLENENKQKIIYVVPYTTVRGFALYSGKISFVNEKGRGSEIEFVSSNSPKAEWASQNLGSICKDGWVIKEKAIFRPKTGGFETCALRYEDYNTEIWIDDLRHFYETGKGQKKIEESAVDQTGVHGLGTIDILDQEQNRIIRRPISGKLFVTGEAGTGKTVTMVRRISLLSAYEGLHEEDKKTYGPTKLPTWSLYFPSNSLRNFVLSGIQNTFIHNKMLENIESWENQRINFSQILGISIEKIDTEILETLERSYMQSLRNSDDVSDHKEILDMYETNLIKAAFQAIREYNTKISSALFGDRIRLTLNADETQESGKRQEVEVNTQIYPQDPDNRSLDALVKWESDTRKFINQRKKDLQGSFFLVFIHWQKHIQGFFSMVNGEYKTTDKYNEMYGDDQKVPLGYISKMVNNYRSLLKHFLLNDRYLFSGMRNDKFDADKFLEFLEPGLVTYLKIDKRDYDYLVNLATYIKFLDTRPSIDLDLSMSLWNSQSLQSQMSRYTESELIDLRIYSQLKKLKILNQRNLLNSRFKKIYNQIMSFSKDQIYIDEVNNLSPFAASVLSDLGMKGTIFAGDLRQKTQNSIRFDITSDRDLIWAFGKYETIELKRSYRLSQKLQYFVFTVLRSSHTIDLSKPDKYTAMLGDKPSFIEDSSINKNLGEIGIGLLSLIKSWIIKSHTFPTILIICPDLEIPLVTTLKLQTSRFLDEMLYLSKEEALLLDKHLKFFEGLDNGDIEPKTNDQRHFARVCRGLDYPKTSFEKAYNKYKIGKTNPIRFKDLTEIEGHQSECSIVLDPQLITDKKILNLALTRSSSKLGFVFTEPNAWSIYRRYLDKHTLSKDIVELFGA